jgi:phage terminase large subunit-like protein
VRRKGIDKATRSWIRTPGDELAAKEGCRFDPETGHFVVEWIQRYCRLYEGEAAGQNMELRDWQLEATMRLFGWVRWSDRWKRWVRRFTQASIWVPKKNKKSPTLAAWGLYLLCGDGEQGQKVFLAAKDGTQAREIAGKHALEMLMQSEELSAECTINRSLMQITHEPSRSVMRPLSSSNSKTQESKEGLNGSVLIDETHVVDREFVDRISRAGISRAEPLHLEVSTAGNNPDGYGKSRFDYAVSVLDGRMHDPRLFVMAFTAPQDLADKDLDADPAKYGKMANPAWGHTIDPEEYLDDYRRSRTSLTSLGNFKMYRLNVWQGAASPWLKQGDWAACTTAFTADDLAGRECYAGLDLSRTQDMSSLVLMFPDDDGGAHVLPFFWLPEDTARELNSKVAFLEWAKSGHLLLTPGNVVDYGFIKGTIRELAARYKILELAYDQKYAEELTQSIEQGQVGRDGQVIEEALGITRVVIPQTIMALTGPTKEFERYVLGKLLRHNGHPILAWQAGHVQVRTDANANIRPVKPKPNDIRKVDGIVASIMAMSRMMLRAPKQKTSIYERRGLIEI